MVSKKILSVLFILSILFQGCGAIHENERHSYKWQIGMTKQQVLGSVDGEPRRINKTTTASGTREQWVYAGPSYLYFDESGILKRIDSPY